MKKELCDVCGKDAVPFPEQTFIESTLAVKDRPKIRARFLLNGKVDLCDEHAEALLDEMSAEIVKARNPQPEAAPAPAPSK